MSYIGISIFKDLISLSIFDSADKITRKVLLIRNTDSSISMFPSLQPVTNILDSIRFDLFSDSLFEAIGPFTFIDSVLFSTYKFDDSITITLIFSKTSTVYVFAWYKFITPLVFLPFSNFVKIPPTEIKFTFVVP